VPLKPNSVGRRGETLSVAPWYFYMGSPSFGFREARMSRTFILLGLILVAVGLLWPWIGWLRLGRLPGDIVVERQNFTFYFPITTGLLISVALTLFLWLVNR
jgi:Protein of unknown function (DUF2905)